MAIVIPMRKKYKPRNIVEYVVDNVMRLRSNCESITHPNTPLQQRYKSRFKLIHSLQRGITPLFQQGFDRKRSDKERWVGAYHVALGHNMTEAAQLQEDGVTWQCDFARFTISENESKAPKRITVQRKGNLLILSYIWKEKAQRTGILWAVYNRKREKWVHGIENTHLTGQMRACALPPEWKEEPVEVLIGLGRDAQGRGQLRGTHHFSFDKSEGIITVKGGMHGIQSAVTQGNTHHITEAVTLGKNLPPTHLSWVEIKDYQGMTLKIKVYYLME